MSDNKEEISLLIDCDPGVDDLAAMMMAFSQSPRVKTVGITCVKGNTNIDNVVMNALRTVKLYDLIEKVPVFRGCSMPLLPDPHSKEGLYHGKDGFGEVPHIEPCPSEDLLKHVQEEHAVNAIIRLSKEYDGKLMIVAIGPLTNLAMAVRMDRDLPARLHSLHILGGTSHGIGNITLAAEFNFFIDPEAANIVLWSYADKCRVQLTPLETTDDHVIPEEWHDQWLKNADNPRAKFFKEAYKHTEAYEVANFHNRKVVGYCLYDAYTMCSAVRPESVLKSRKVKACVELGGLVSRGNLLLDRKGKGSPYLSNGSITIIEEIDMVIYKEMLIKALK